MLLNLRLLSWMLVIKEKPWNSTIFVPFSRSDFDTRQEFLQKRALPFMANGI